jgi:hypothetical protein
MTAVSSGPDPAATGRRPTSLGSGILWIAILALASFGCSAAPPPPPPEPIDATGVADNVRLRTIPQEPVRILFDWSLNESGSRTSGRGVVRMEPPYKARLDLFTGNGETVLRAALVDDVLRLPPGVESQEIVPPPALLWASLGVFRPGNLAFLNGGESVGDDQIRLSYGYNGGEEVRYHLTGDEVGEVELLRGGNAAEVVAIEASTEHPFPQETVYRNLGEFRELTLTLDVYEHVDVYPPDIWLESSRR